MKQSRAKGTEGELVVFVTASSRKEAKAIAASLVNQRLAACATVVGVVESLYRWQGKVERSFEAMLVIKTTMRRFPGLEREVRAMHSYKVPEIIALPIVRGSRGYLTWIRDQTGK